MEGTDLNTPPGVIGAIGLVGEGALVDTALGVVICKIVDRAQLNAQLETSSFVCKVVERTSRHAGLACGVAPGIVGTVETGHTQSGWRICIGIYWTGLQAELLVPEVCWSRRTHRHACVGGVVSEGPNRTSSETSMSEVLCVGGLGSRALRNT